MFTGIIEEIGSVIKIVKSGDIIKLDVEALKINETLQNGSSIAVNGVCLTVTGKNKTGFFVDVVGETLQKSNLKHLKSGDKVNLERALSVNSRLDGHFVLGHCDDTGKISDIIHENNNLYIEITPPAWMMKYIAYKGSIALDGISLTVAKCSGQNFTVAIVPFTKNNTTIADRKTGYEINIELDMLAKYIEKLIDKKENSGKITKEFLEKNGFL